MTARLLFLSVLFLSLAAGAQAAPASVNDGTIYSLTGIVQNSVTGEPVAHALVQMVSVSSASTFTDSGGHFEFDNLPAAITTVTARKPGFLSPEETDVGVVSDEHIARTRGPIPVVKVGPATPPVTLRLVPEAIVFGHALRPDGEPIGYLTVQLFYLQISDGHRKVLPMSAAQTNEEGEYRIAGLRPGTYYLQAGPRFMSTWIGAPGERAREAAYRPVFYPGVPDLPSAAPLQLSPGQQLQADLSLSPDPVFRVSGTLVGLPPGATAEDVFPRLTVLPRDNRSVAIPVEAQPGNDFQAKIPAGSYIVRADIDTPHGPYGGDLPVTVQSDIGRLNVIVAPAPELRVEVSVQRTHLDATPVPRSQGQVNVHFISQDLKGPTLENSFLGGTVRGLEPGVYAVEITPMDSSFYVDSAQCGGVDLLRDNLTVGAGSPPVRVLLRDDGGNLVGNIVADGHAAPGVALIIPDRAPMQIKVAAAGNSGQFVTSKLPPGDYAVLAFDGINDLEYANPEVLSPFLANAVHVSVVANGESHVTVNRIRAGK